MIDELLEEPSIKGSLFYEIVIQTLKTELKKSQALIANLQQLLRVQQELSERKNSIDRVKSIVTAKLKSENLILVFFLKIQQNKVKDLQEINEQHERDITKIRELNMTLQNQYESIMEELRIQSCKYGQVDNSMKQSQIKHQPQSLPLPPPPPLPSDQMALSSRRKPRRKVKQIVWDTIPKSKLDNTIWQGLDDELVELDWDKLEEQFSMKNSNTFFQSTSPQAMIRAISFLTNERQRAIELIMVKHKLTSSSLTKNLIIMNSQVLNGDIVDALIKSLPKNKELELLMQKVTDYNQLSIPDKLVYDLSKIPYFEQRLRSMQFKENYDEMTVLLGKRLETIRQACIFFRSDTNLRQLFENVLATGNFLNGLSNKGVASGFKLDSFEKTLNMKALDQHTTLLSLIIENLLNHSKGEFYISVPYEIYDATNYSLIQLFTELQEIKAGLRDLEDILLLRDDAINQKFEEFCETVKQYCVEKSEQYRVSSNEYEITCRYFCQGLSNYESDKIIRKLLNIYDWSINAQKQLEMKQQEERRKQAELKTQKQLNNYRQSIMMQPEIMTQMIIQQQVNELKQNSLADLIRLKKQLTLKKKQ